MQLPRVLIVGTGRFMDGQGGRSVTLRTLFADWPAGELGIASTDFGDGEEFPWRYRIGSLEDTWKGPFGIVRRSGKGSGPLAPGQASSDLRGEGPVRESLLRRFAAAFFHGVVAALGVEDGIRELRLSDSLLEWIAVFAPDVIYTHGESLKVVRLVQSIGARTGIPVVVHVMDDWPRHLYTRGLLRVAAQRRLETAFTDLARDAAAVLTIGDDMREAFQKRYGLDSTPVHNAVDIAEWDAAASERHSRAVPVAVYVGRLARSNSKALLDVARCVDSLDARGVRVRMDVYTPDESGWTANRLRKLGSVTVNPPVPHEDIPGLLADADLLILPLDFGRESRGFARLSIPTKLAEYMASGTPILVYAPEQTAVARYVAREGCGVVVTRRNGALLTAAVRATFSDPEPSRRMARRARSLALAIHDARATRAKFIHALTQAAAGPLADGAGEHHGA
jgi:glycosyltransferase involved in cell wall biosynthesis